MAICKSMRCSKNAIIFWAVTLFLASMAVLVFYEKLPAGLVSVDRKSIYIHLNDTNNWLGHEVVEIKNPDGRNMNVSWSYVNGTEIANDPSYPKVYIWPYPVQNTQQIMIEVNSTNPTYHGNIYYGRVILLDLDKDSKAVASIELIINNMPQEDSAPGSPANSTS